MLSVKVVASGSTGNCTALKSSAGEMILLDAGVTMKKLLSALEYKMADYVLITHEHCDHAFLPAVRKLLTNGAEMYMTAGTKEALKLTARHNLKTFKAGLNMSPIKLGGCEMVALKVHHDAAEPVAFNVYDGEDSILYATDMKEPPESGGTTFTKIIIEANHSERTLARNIQFEWRIKRVGENHTSIERLIKWFKGHKFPFLKEVHLIHISKQNGNGEMFKSALEKVIDVPIYVY